MRCRCSQELHFSESMCSPFRVMSDWLDEAGTDALFGDGHVPCLRVLATGHSVGWDPDRSVVPSQADRPEHILALAATSIGASLHDLRLQGALPDPPYACEDARARRFVRVRARVRVCACACVRVLSACVVRCR